MKNIYFIIITLLLLFSCAGYQDVYLNRDLKKAKLLGRVITEEGLPLDGVRVRLTDTIDTKTDINGRFLFNFLAFGNYKIRFEKNDYLDEEYDLEYTFKNRKRAPFIKIKMLSTNYLVNEGFEYLKEKKFDKTEEIINQLENINREEEVVKYLKAIYLYENKSYNEALPILEELKEKDRKNIYYQLTLLNIYSELDMNEEYAKLSYYVGITDPRNYYKYLKLSADTYKDDLNNQEEYEKIIEEYNKYKSLYDVKR